MTEQQRKFHTRSSTIFRWSVRNAAGIVDEQIWYEVPLSR